MQGLYRGAGNRSDGVLHTPGATGAGSRHSPARASTSAQPVPLVVFRLRGGHSTGNSCSRDGAGWISGSGQFQREGALMMEVGLTRRVV